jgi:hypothetical protein
MDIYLQPTHVIDCENEVIKDKAALLISGEQDIPGKARRLFYFVRDEIKYNLYVSSDKIDYFTASRILQIREGFCVQKAVLMTALSRAAGIPTRLRIAAIRNHLMPDKLKNFMRGNILPTHGYNELYINDRWVKAAPTFDRDMCLKNRFKTVEFDGIHDATLPAENSDGERHIEYVKDYGHFDDLPFERIIALRKEALGDDFFERMDRVIASRKKGA